MQSGNKQTLKTIICSNSSIGLFKFGVHFFSSKKSLRNNIQRKLKKKRDLKTLLIIYQVFLTKISSLFNLMTFKIKISISQLNTAF
jgi:hypothetical protein